MYPFPRPLQPAAALPAVATGVAGGAAALDGVLYDLRALSAVEAAALALRPPRPGSMLIVRPSPGAGIERAESAAAVDALLGAGARHVSLSGGQGSAAGSVALARALARHLDAPVVAVVPGSEAATLALATAWPALFGIGSGVAQQLARSLRTTAALDALLGRNARIGTLLGHGEGAAILAAGIAGRREGAGGPARTPTDAALSAADVITLGAVVDLPAPVSRATQYLGALDGWGRALAAQGVPYVPVEGAGRSLNPALPFHIDLPRLLARRAA